MFWYGCYGGASFGDLCAGWNLINPFWFVRLFTSNVKYCALVYIFFNLLKFITRRKCCLFLSSIFHSFWQYVAYIKLLKPNCTQTWINITEYWYLSTINNTGQQKNKINKMASKHQTSFLVNVSVLNLQMTLHFLG